MPKRAVVPERARVARVAGYLLDGGLDRSVGQQARDEGATEVVRGDLDRTVQRPLPHPADLGPEAVAGELASSLPRQEVRRALVEDAELRQCLLEGGMNRDRPLLVALADEVQRLLGEGHVVPSQRADLSRPHAGVGEQVEA